MKYLILLLLSFNIHAQVIGCKIDTEANINACTLEQSGLPDQAALDEWKVYQLAALAERHRVQAQKDRLIAIGGKFGKYKSFSGLGRHFEKCNYKASNKAKFVYDELLKAGNETMINCLENEHANVESEKLAKKAKSDSIKAAKNSLKSQNCLALEAIAVSLKDMCIILKGE